MGRQEHKHCCSQCEEEKTCSSSTNCTFSWSITPIQTTAGSPITFSGVNLPPNLTFQVRVKGANTDYYWTITSNDAGVANASMSAPVAEGSYQFTPVVASCTPAPSRNSITVVASGTNPETPCDCLGSVSIKPIFLNPILYSGTTNKLSLIVTNTNRCPATNITMPALALPSGLTGVISVANIAVPGNSSVTLTYDVIANNSTSSDIQATVTVPAQTATYKCNDTPYFAGGSSAYATIKSPATGSCALAITDFSVAPNSIASGGSATFSLTIKNTGGSTLTDLAFGPISLASGVVTPVPTVTLAASGVTLAAGATKVVTAMATFTKSQTGNYAHTVTIPSGAITAKCNFGNISNLNPASTVLIITD
jgi:uncharacterized membrane protein